MDANHYVLLTKIFDKKMNSPLRVVLERQFTKKEPNGLVLKYQSFLIQKIHFKMMLCNKKNVSAKPWPFIVKNHISIQGACFGHAFSKGCQYGTT